MLTAGMSLLDSVTDAERAAIGELDVLVVAVEAGGPVAAGAEAVGRDEGAGVLDLPAEVGRVEAAAEDRFVDLVEEGFDLAIRVTKLEDSGLIARKITDFGLNICATPEFIARHKGLDHPTGLANVPCLIDSNSRRKGVLRFFEPDGSSFSVQVAGPIEVNSPTATLRGALAGLGVALLPDFVARKHIENGELVVLFNEYLPSDRGIYAVYPHRRHLPAKVRTFVDFLQAWFKKM